MVDFEKAVQEMNTRLAKSLTDEDLIEIYGLYKQATVGDINVDKPAETDIKVSVIYITVQITYRVPIFLPYPKINNTTVYLPHKTLNLPISKLQYTD